MKKNGKSGMRANKLSKQQWQQPLCTSQPIQLEVLEGEEEEEVGEEEAL